jgi:predicted acyltransferase (DUF342 family)
MSIFCDHCRKRLILENLSIKTYQAVRAYATCGDVVVEKTGRVRAPIQAGSLIVKGVVDGNVSTPGQVEIAATGSLVGDVAARSLIVRQGAQMTGFCRICPPEVAAVLAGSVSESNVRASASANVATGNVPSASPNANANANANGEDDARRPAVIRTRSRAPRSA